MSVMRNIITFLIYISLCEVQSEYEYNYDYGVTDVKNCSTSESIIGGSVKYSNGGAPASLVIYHCSEGFEPYPISQKVCNADGEWEPKVSRVKCEEISDYGDYYESAKNCSMEVSIKGGTVSYSNKGMEGSVLTYQCEEGYYPFPTVQRVCDRDGQWSAMKLPNGKRTLSAVCKDILCPAQLQLDNGQFWPRKQWFKIGEVQSFSCDEGFTLIGSAERNCTQWGGWSGTTPVCDDKSEDCRDPGTPPGAKRSGHRFRIDDRVRYQCQFGLDILGPSERQCLESREWSGAEPRCYAQYSFDQPASVAQALGGSLTAALDVSIPAFKKKGQSLGRTINVNGEGRLNVFILLDTSGSISPGSFQTAKNAINDLIRKLDSYEVTMNFEIISYAGEPKSIVSITDFGSQDVDYVLEKLHNFNETVHGNKKGTDLSKALEKVYGQLGFLRENRRSQFNETQNIIIIATDGHSNMGPSPLLTLAKIRSLLGYKPSVDHTHEELLDVYLFAVGQDVNKKDLRSIASSKKDEQHLFVLKDYKQLGYVFNRMISDSAVTKCGVAKEKEDSKESFYTKPWHVNLLWGTKTCRGSLVTESMVLTAAHCLIKANGVKAMPADIKISHGHGEFKAEELIVHNQFDVSGLKDKNVNEFYDYDIALIRMSKNITISPQTRPICLPCTKSSSRALRMGPDATCDQHKKLLLHLEETPAHFIRKGNQRSDTLIHSGSKRDECVEKARSILPVSSKATLSEIITDRFMCTGGSDKSRHQMTCKGDSGGALLLRNRMRYFQVAVISWGSKQTCDSRGPSLDASDFHISVFALLPWLQKHLHQQLHFIP